MVYEKQKTLHINQFNHKRSQNKYTKSKTTFFFNKKMEELQNFITLTNEKKDIMDEIAIQRRPVNDVLLSKKKELESLCEAGTYHCELDGVNYLFGKVSSSKLSASDFDLVNIRKNLMKLKQENKELGGNLYDALINQMKDTKPTTQNFTIRSVKTRPDKSIASTHHMNQILKDYVYAQQQLRDLIEMFQTKKNDMEKTLRTLEAKISENLDSQVEVPIEQQKNSNYLVETRKINRNVNRKQFKEAFNSAYNDLGVKSLDAFFLRLDDFMNTLSTKIQELEKKETKLQLRKKIN